MFLQQSNVLWFCRSLTNFSFVTLFLKASIVCMQQEQHRGPETVCYTVACQKSSMKNVNCVWYGLLLLCNVHMYKQKKLEKEITQMKLQI